MTDGERKELSADTDARTQLASEPMNTGWSKKGSPT